MASIDDLFSCFNDQDDDRITANPVVKAVEEPSSEPVAEYLLAPFQPYQHNLTCVCF